MSELSKRYGIKVFRFTLRYNGKRFPIKAHFGERLEKLDLGSPDSSLSLVYSPPADCSTLDAALSSMMGNALESAGEIAVVRDTLSSALAAAEGDAVAKKSTGDDALGAMLAILDVFATGSFMVSDASEGEGAELLAVENACPGTHLDAPALAGGEGAVPPAEAALRPASLPGARAPPPTSALDPLDAERAWASTLRWLEVALADVPGALIMRNEARLMSRLDDDSAPLLNAEAYRLGVALNMSTSSFISQLEASKRLLGSAGPTGTRRSPYDVLGCDRNCSDDDLRAAYKAAVLRTHPDKGGDAAAFLEVREAWQQIMQERQTITETPAEPPSAQAPKSKDDTAGGSALESRIKPLLQAMDDCVQEALHVVRQLQSLYYSDVALCLKFGDTAPVAEWTATVREHFDQDGETLTTLLKACSGALYQAAAAERSLCGEGWLRDLTTEEVSFSVAVRDLLPELARAEGAALPELLRGMASAAGHLDEMFMSLGGLQAVCQRLRNLYEPPSEPGEAEGGPPAGKTFGLSGPPKAEDVSPLQERRLVDCLRATARRSCVLERQKLRTAPPKMVRDRLFELLQACCADTVFVLSECDLSHINDLINRRSKAKCMQLPASTRGVVYCDPRLTLLRLCSRLDMAATQEVLRSACEDVGKWLEALQEWGAAK